MKYYVVLEEIEGMNIIVMSQSLLLNLYNTRLASWLRSGTEDEEDAT